LEICEILYYHKMIFSLLRDSPYKEILKIQNFKKIEFQNFGTFDPNGTP
jgi:hypothetical protein